MVARNYCELDRPVIISGSQLKADQEGSSFCKILRFLNHIYIGFLAN